MNEDLKTLVTMIRHQALVSARLRELARHLEKRADLHDLSKYRFDEFEGFVQINQVARKYPYGSKEYMESIKDNNVVDLHFGRNRHHPEYHANEVNDMTLIDIIEMVCDWSGAAETYGTNTFRDSLGKQIKRFDLTSEQLYLIELIADFFNE